MTTSLIDDFPNHGDKNTGAEGFSYSGILTMKKLLY